MSYFLFIFTIFLIYVTLATSLNVLVGYAGLLSLTHAAFVGIGAYSVAIAMSRYGFGWIQALVVAIVISILVALVVGIVTLPVRDIYYIVVSFALQVIMFNVFLNWRSFTGGALGLSGIPKPAIGSYPISSGLRYLVFAAIISSLTLLILSRFVGVAYGRVLRAIREDETAAAVLGKRVARKKVEVFIVSSTVAAVGGTMLAPLLTFIHPSSFTIHETIFLLSMVIVGGPGNLAGSLLGAGLLVAIPELLTFTDFGGASQAQLRQVLYATALILFVRWRPQGLLPEGAVGLSWPFGIRGSTRTGGSEEGNGQRSLIDA